MGDQIRVLLADDHPVVRQGLRSLLSTAGDIEVVEEARDGQEAVEKAAKYNPNVVLMDLRMPALDGLEAIRRIRRESPSISVIVLTMYDQDAFVVAAIKAGAGGYLLKDTAGEQLVHTIRAVHGGSMLIKPPLPQAYSLSARQKPTSPSTVKGLTPQERLVLHLMTKGHTHQAIGSALSIAEEAASELVQSLLAKLATFEPPKQQ